eukprot:gene14526-19502_t
MSIEPRESFIPKINMNMMKLKALFLNSGIPQPRLTIGPTSIKILDWEPTRLEFRTEYSEVNSLEVGSNRSEDLSSLHQWLGEFEGTQQAVMAYWLCSTFGNCGTIATGLLECIHHIQKRLHITEVVYNDIVLSLSSAEIEGFSVSVKFGSKTCIQGNSEPIQQHFPHEGHNHIVLTLLDAFGKKYVVDLSGLQFGIYGEDVRRPHIVIEPLEIWRLHFEKFKSVDPSFTYQNKLDLMKNITNVVITTATDEYLKMNHHSVGSTRIKPAQMSKEELDAKSLAVEEMMAKLLLEEEEEEEEKLRNQTKTNDKGKKSSKKSNKKK